MKSVNLMLQPLEQIKVIVWRARLGAHFKVKRVIDISVSLAILIILSPLLLFVGVLIKMDSNGGIIFKQERVGINGSSFFMWKFRSMVVDAELLRAELEQSNEMENGVIFKMKRDPRITRVGAIIRKTSIDELPQLFNVLKGDMSLVGPRPSLPSEVRDYNRNDRRRLQVLPGITCIWQVNGRSNIPFEQQVELDLHYIQNQSIWFDFVLLFKTIPAVIFARGAY